MLLALVLILSLGPPARTARVTIQDQSAVTQLLNELQSPDVRRRERAFNELLRTPVVLADPVVSGAIVDLLERETRLIETTLRESKGEIGVSDKYGEGFGEYYSAVALRKLIKALALQNLIHPIVEDVAAASR